MRPVDARSDIYSLGATLYEFLTAQAPFHAHSEFEILNDHVNTPPPPPSRLSPLIPRSVENAVLKALAKSPDQRFQTAEEFSAALEQPESFYAAKTVVEAVPAVPVAVVPVPRAVIAVAPPPLAPPVPTKPAFWTMRRKLLAAAGAALAGLLVALLIFLPKTRQPVVVQAPPPPASAPPAPAPAAPPMAAKPAPAASRIVVPAGTKISVRTVDLIDSKTSRLGQEFRATLATAVKVKGHEAFRVSDKARLRLEETASSGHSGKPELILELVSIATGGRTYIVSSAPFLIKARFWRKKRVAPGTPIDFTLNAPVTLGAPPS